MSYGLPAGASITESFAHCCGIVEKGDPLGSGDQRCAVIIGRSGVLNFIRGN